MCTATVDTQTAGDVLRPAAYNGVVGFKPSIGWAPIEGTQPVAPTIDTIGVMAGRVADAAAVAAALADEPARFTIRAAPCRPRIGVLRDPYYRELDADVRTNLAAALHRFADEGAVVEDAFCPVDLTVVHAAHRIITFAECAAEHYDRYHHDASHYGPRARELLDLGLVTPAPVCFHAQGVRRETTELLTDMFHDLDVVALPVIPGPAPSRRTTGDSRFQIPWTLCGFPTLTLPSGEAAGLPLAVQLVAAPDEEANLLTVARWCEDVLDLHLTPIAPAV